MLEIAWNADKGWDKPVISPMHDLQIHPGAKVLHYAIEARINGIFHKYHLTFICNHNLIISYLKV